MNRTFTLVLTVLLGVMLFNVSRTDEETVPLRDSDGLTNLALLPHAQARASSVYANGALAIHQIKHLNDGKYNNAHSWISAGEPSWVEVDLGEVCRVAKVVFGSEHNAHYKDRAATRFEILVATDSNATKWNRVLEYEGDPKAGETQTCIGCHEQRNTTPPKGQWINGSMGQGSKKTSTVNHQPSTMPLALQRAPSKIAPPPWGAGVFSFKKIVQPVLDKHCVACHNREKAEGKVDLSWTLGADSVPASYRTLIRNGYVRYVDTGWHATNAVLKPLTFGTTQSKLIQLIDACHYDVRLTAAERERITT